MRAMLAPALLWISAIGCGLMAGVYFAFSAFIMTTLTAASLAVLGMFGVTMMVSQPMNEALLAADPASPQGVALWSRYLIDWTMWNHVRTITSTVSTAMFIAALTAR
jgi:uncharacterized membrane protein